MVVAAPAVFRELRRQNSLQHIMLLHVAESSTWATFYYTSELFQDFETSLYFSLVSYTAIGYGDVVLPQNWCDSGRFRSFALRTFHCLHLRGYERDVQSKNATTTIPMAGDAGTHQTL